MASTSYSIVMNAIAAVAPGDGFMDPKTMREYIHGGAEPASFENATAKARANARYGYVVHSIHTLGNIYIREVEVTGGDVDTAPTSITLTVESEHGDAVLRTADELNPGSFLTGAAAIERAVARAYTTQVDSDFAEIYDPTTSTHATNATSYPRVGTRIDKIVTGRLTNNLLTAEASITVTAL